MLYTVKQLNTVINKWIDDDEDGEGQCQLEEFFQSSVGDKLKINKEVTLKLVESKRLGGEEGDSSDYMVVFTIVGTNQLFRIDGYYNSWDGTTFSDSDGYYEVERTEKVIFVYHKKKKAKVPAAKSRLQADLRVDPV